MQDSQVAMLNHQGIIKKVPYLIYCLFSPHTPDINFRLEIELTLHNERITVGYDIFRP
jgi:hypothetical protein